MTWTGNRWTGTSSHAAYNRTHQITAFGKHTIEASADPSFRGDPARWNPEELLLASLSACHQLWYLALCAEAGVVVTAYEDNAQGTMIEEPGGAGRFSSVTLRPRVVAGAGVGPGAGTGAARPCRRNVLHRALGELPDRMRASD